MQNNRSGNDIMVHYLTGLPNAGGYLQNIVELAKTNDLQSYTAFYINLKGFGNLNARYGTELADKLIISFSESVLDFLDENELLGHLGGDNFVALVKKEKKEKFCRLLHGVDIPLKKDDKEEMVRVSATMGLWDIDKPIREPGEIIGRPSVALQHAKHILHKPVVSVTEDMMKKVAQQKTVLEKFQKALENREFKVFYQPKVDSRTGMLVGAEALVRWFEDDKMISPGIFIPPLEENGEILLLDYYVLKRTCEDINAWISEGIEPVPISVNFSRKDLMDKDLSKNIDRIIMQSGVNKKLIEVEVTETVDEQEHGELSVFISDLFERGIMTAIDDFGAGYSSLATLREFDVHTLKIDRSFINRELFSWKDTIILTDIIHMAGELGIDVITEGVEREDQIEFLHKVGCYIIQGFYYDRPLPKEEFRERLINKQYKKEA